MQRTKSFWSGYRIIMFDQVNGTLYKEALREGGSLPGLMRTDDGGDYVVKFRGNAQGCKVLVAELIAGELARRLGLPVPDLVLLTLSPDFGATEQDIDVQQLLRASRGTNVALEFLDGAVTYQPDAGDPPSGPTSSEIVWFDAFVMNPDRSALNPNFLVWRGKHWLIDHGAALYVHGNWRDPEGFACDDFETFSREHVLIRQATGLRAADERLRPMVTIDLLESIVEAVPDDLLADDALGREPDATRTAYVDWLSARIGHADAWVDAAERAHGERT